MSNPEPAAPAALTSATLAALADLYGRKLRIARPGEFLTQDVQPGRVTIFVDQENRIERIQIDAPGSGRASRA